MDLNYDALTMSMKPNFEIQLLISQLSEGSEKVFDQIYTIFSPRKREIFLLNRKQALSYAEIAQKLGISIKIVWNQMDTAQVTKTGTKYFLLPDSPEVWLNAESQLNYSTEINKSQKRIVSLKGQAYFNVYHDAAHPFIIQTNQLDTKGARDLI